MSQASSSLTSHKQLWSYGDGTTAYSLIQHARGAGIELMTPD